MTGLGGWNLRCRLTHRGIFYKREESSRACHRLHFTATTIAQTSGPQTQARKQVRMSKSEQVWTANAVRERFLKYFEDKHHTIGTYKSEKIHQFLDLQHVPCHASLAWGLHNIL